MNSKKCYNCQKEIKPNELKPNVELQQEILDKKLEEINNENYGEELLDSMNPPQFSLYNHISPSKLRKELDSFGLDKIKGKKDVMVEYHKEFCLKLMAENDSINPVSKGFIIELVIDNYFEQKQKEKEEKKPKKEKSENEKKKKAKKIEEEMKKQNEMIEKNEKSEEN